MKIGSPLPLDLTNDRVFKKWLYQLWQSVGGSTDLADELEQAQQDIDTLQNDVVDIENNIIALDDRIDVIEANYTITKQTIVDLGSTYIQDKTVNVIDAEITATSIIECSIAPVASGYTRPIEEVIYERIMVYATPKAGSIDFYLQPERGHFMGQFVINYMVKI
jgi:hypothetical protein